MSIESVDVADELLKKLSYYENAEEEGRLIILPCKPGDTLYELDWTFDTCPRLRSGHDCGDCPMEDCPPCAGSWIIKKIKAKRHQILVGVECKSFGRYLFTNEEAAKQRKMELEKGGESM